MSAQFGWRFSAAKAMNLDSCRTLACGITVAAPVDDDLHLTAEHGGQCRAGALERHVQQLDAGEGFEQRAAEMVGRGRARVP